MSLPADSPEQLYKAGLREDDFKKWSGKDGRAERRTQWRLEKLETWLQTVQALFDARAKNMLVPKRASPKSEGQPQVRARASRQHGATSAAACAVQPAGRGE